MEKLLNKSQIAEALGTTPCIAASILETAGVQRIDFGAGRSRGSRWLASAVFSAIAEMHQQAQTQKYPAKKKEKRCDSALTVSLASMSASEIYDLTYKPCVQ